MVDHGGDCARYLHFGFVICFLFEFVLYYCTLYLMSITNLLFFIS
jgi:hypothetical protein